MLPRPIPGSKPRVLGGWIVAWQSPLGTLVAMWTLFLLMTLLGPGGAGPSQADSTPKVELESAAGVIQRLPLQGLELSDPREKGAVFVRFVDLPGAKSTPEQALVPGHPLRLQFVGGGSLSGFLAGGTAEQLELALPGGSRCSLGIDQISSFQLPEALSGQDGLPVAPEEGDRLYLVRGRGLDRLDGLTVGFSSEGLLFEGPLGERLHPWKEVAALYIEALSAPEESSPTPGVVEASITTRTGGAFNAQLLGITEAGLSLRLGTDEFLLLPQDVAELAVQDSSYGFLSNLKPTDLGPLNPFDTEEVIGQSWPMRANQAVGGGPLQVGGRLFHLGLGVHAPSRITWNLAGEWNRLRTRIGVDDSAGRGSRGGTVRFRVLVDGELRYESGEVRVGSPALVVPPVDLVGAKELVLEVDPLDDWVLDRADWLRPILLKE